MKENTEKRYIVRIGITSPLPVRLSHSNALTCVTQATFVVLGTLLLYRKETRQLKEKTCTIHLNI